MTTADNKEVVHRYQTAWEQADLATLGELLADEFVNHSLPLPPTRDEMLEFAAEHRRQFPTGIYAIRQLVAEGDLVFVFGNYHGVHTGEPFEGIPASGAVADFDYFILLRLTNGKIIERWGAADDVMGMLIPLGYELIHPGGR
jgi:predicted ester cyclase